MLCNLSTVGGASGQLLSPAAYDYVSSFNLYVDAGVFVYENVLFSSSQVVSAAAFCFIPVAVDDLAPARGDYRFLIYVFICHFRCHLIIDDFAHQSIFSDVI